MAIRPMKTRIARRARLTRTLRASKSRSSLSSTSGAHGFVPGSASGSSSGRYNISIALWFLLISQFLPGCNRFEQQFAGTANARLDRTEGQASDLRRFFHRLFADDHQVGRLAAFPRQIRHGVPEQRDVFL